jgi:hypothetical protein
MLLMLFSSQIPIFILSHIIYCCFLFSWNYCGKDTLLEDKNLTYIDEVTITLTMSPCSL